MLTLRPSAAAGRNGREELSRRRETNGLGVDGKHEDENGQRGREGHDQAHVPLLVFTRITIEPHD